MICKPEGANRPHALVSAVESIQRGRESLDRTVRGKTAIGIWYYMTGIMAFGVLGSMASSGPGVLLIGGPIVYGCYWMLQKAKRQAREQADR